MIGLTFDWFNLFVNQVCGSLWLSVLVTIGIYLFILLIGRVSYQMIIQILLIASAYFVSLFFAGKIVMIMILFIAIGNIYYQLTRTIGREQ